MKNSTFKKALALIICVAMIAAGGTFSLAETTTATDDNSDSSLFKPVSVDTENTLPEVSDENITDTTTTVVEPYNSTQVETVPKATVDFSKFKDVSTHWAKADLKRAVEDGLLQGFSDNTLRPNTEITLAQMITIITRILKPEIIGLSGAPSNAWYKNAADKAEALGLITIKDSTDLNSPTNRQKACAMIAESFQLCTADPDKKAGTGFKDYSRLNSRERLIFASLIEQGYIQGYNGSLMLASSITRAEFVTILYRIADSYVDGTTFSNSGAVSNTVVSATDFQMKNTRSYAKIWADATAENVSIENSTAPAITLRSDNLKSLTISNSNIDRLCIAARYGSIDLNCGGIDTTVIGSGGGNIVLNPEGNNVEVTGSSRTIDLTGSADKVAISGDNNLIFVSENADISSLILNGTGNVINIDSNVDSLSMYGKSNKVKGSGSADTVILYTGKSTISIDADETIDRIDNGIADMGVVLYSPGTITFNQYFTVNSGFTGDVPDGTTVNYTWTLAGKELSSGTMVLNSSKPPVLSYYYTFNGVLADTMNVGLKLEYTTTEGEYQVVEASPVAVNLDKTSSEYLKAVVSSVKTTYTGNRTTQWAIDNDYSTAVKEAFVNYKGYSSSSQYLIWVNIGTQHCNIFQGSAGKWKLIRSSLVATGAGDCTPRGVFKTTYKQTDWTTDTYTVKPIVRFYGGGYAMHSRLYYPGTSKLKPGSGNGVGYPLSHGCVRMQDADIQWVYNNIPNGTTIVVY